MKTAGGWLLSGVKLAVPAAGDPHTALTAAATDAGPALFAVGVEGADAAPQIGTDFAPLVQLTFSDAPADRLGGSEALQWLQDHLRVAQCAAMLGLAETALIMAAKYTATREQFGQPIGAFQACLLYTSPSPRDLSTSRMPSSA